MPAWYLIKGSIYPIIEIIHDRIGFMTSFNPTDRYNLLNIEEEFSDNDEFTIDKGSIIRVYGYRVEVTDVKITVLKDQTGRSSEANFFLRVLVKDAR